MSAYDEFMEFIAQNRSAEEILAFKASPEAQRRADELTERNKTGTLTEAERLEFGRTTKD